MADGADFGAGKPRLKFTSDQHSDAGNIGANASGFSAPDFSASVGGNGNGGNDDFDPSQHIGRDKRNADGSYRRKRAKRGSGGGTSSGSGRKTRQSLQASVDTLSQVLIVLHSGIASIAGPEFSLDSEDANDLGGAIVNVMDQYDIPIDPKTAAIVGLIVVCGKVYGPKIIMRNMRAKAEKAEERPSADIEPIDYTTLGVG